MKKIAGLTVDPSMNQPKEGIDFIMIPVYSQEPDEYGCYVIIRYIKEATK